MPRISAKPNRYTEIIVVVDGSVEDVIQIAYNDRSPASVARALREHATAMQNLMMAAAEDAHALPVLIYLNDHLHGPEVEDCCCLQYETDHHPDVTYNLKED
jgi:hypothetical protein